MRAANVRSHVSLVLSVVAVTVSAATAIMDWTSTEVVARRIVIRDSAGTERIALGLRDDERAAGISFQDANGGLRLSMASEADGSVGLGLLDQEERQRLSLMVKAGGTPGLLLRAPDSEPLLLISSRPGESKIVAKDGVGSTQVGLISRTEVGSRVFVHGERRVASEMGVDDRGAPFSVIRGVDGTERLKMVLEPDGSASIVVFNEEEVPRLQLNVTEVAAEVRITDDEQRPRVRLGSQGNRQESSDSSWVLVYDRTGVERVAVGSEGTGEASVSLRDTAARELLKLSVDTQSKAGMTVKTDDGATGMVLVSSSADDEAGLFLWDGDEIRLGLKTVKGERAQLVDYQSGSSSSADQGSTR